LNWSRKLPSFENMFIDPWALVLLISSEREESRFHRWSWLLFRNNEQNTGVSQCSWLIGTDKTEMMNNWICFNVKSVWWYQQDALFVFSLLWISSLYMFKALLAHL
jgi:hypothetical protein